MSLSLKCNDPLVQAWPAQGRCRAGAPSAGGVDVGEASWLAGPQHHVHSASRESRGVSPGYHRGPMVPWGLYLQQVHGQSESTGTTCTRLRPCARSPQSACSRQDV